MSTIINGTSSAITFPDTTVQNTAFTTGAVTQSTIATGVAGTGPAFSAYNATTQTILAATNTLVSLPSELFDTNNNFSSNLFTPTVAGYYQVSGGVYFASAGSPSIVFISKNGIVIHELQRQTSGAGSVLSGSCVIYCNGTTDNLGLYVYSSGGSVIGANSANSNLIWFNGAMVRAA